MKRLLKTEVRKAIGNPFFLLALGIMCLLAILSGVYMIETYGDFNPQGMELFLKDGKFYMDPMLSTKGLSFGWIGGECLSLAHIVFYTLLPVLSALPYAWSLFLERKTGYMRQIVIRVKKSHYYTAKLIAGFISGSLIALIALLINITIVAMFLPIYETHANLYVYTHIMFGQMGADLFYSNPMLVVLLYSILTIFYCGIFSMFSMSLTFTSHTRASVLIEPFVLFLAIQYIEQTVQSSVEKKFISEVVPINFLSQQSVALTVKGPVVVVVTGILIAFIIGSFVYWGRKDEIL